MSNDFSRRDFLRGGAIITLGLASPPWLAKIAYADILKLARGGKVDPENILVVCQLSGGNDGLNTVIPYADSRYYEFRPTLAQEEDAVIKLNDQLGFHPSMKGAEEVFKSGQMAVIQNVGYPNPNRSHFRSMDIWQTANPDKVEKYGWLGKYLDQELKKGSINPILAIGLMRTSPAAFSAQEASVPCFASLADVQQLVGDPDAEMRLREAQGMESGSNASADLIRKANLTALDAMAQLKKSIASYKSNFTYDQNEFGRGFQQIAQIIATSPKTRVIYFAAGGFDTHSRQAETHAQLLGNFSTAVKTFMDEMKAIGKEKKVTVMVFSEFGRRCQENGSQGTDHGAAAPMFVVGGSVKGGFIGSNPDLVNLDRGDLKWHTDFRQVYATVLDEWMGSDSESIFGSKFEHVQIF